MLDKTNGAKAEPSLIEKLRALKATPADKLKAEDVTKLFAEILTKSVKVHPGREGTEMTEERSALVDKIHKGINTVIAEALLEHGVDKASRIIVSTAIGMSVSELNEVYPRFAEHFARILTMTNKARASHRDDLDELIDHLFGGTRNSAFFIIDEDSSGEAHRA